MIWEAWATLGAVAVMSFGLVKDVARPDVILLGTLALLVAMGIVEPNKAVSGFGNEGLITVAVLFVVVAGLTRTGAMSMVTRPLLGRPKSVLGAQTRLMLPVAGLSAFLNNTPLVAMFMPVVDDWARKTRLPASKLFIPLSYASILGGTCTLIGTSTNLVVNGLLIRDYPDLSMSMFDLSPVGIPVAIMGILYMLTVGRWLLPDRKPAISLSDDPRSYTIEMMVDLTSPLAGKTVEQAGLRQLPGLYLAEIDRRGQTIPAVEPTQVLEGGDRLVFVGVLTSVVDLQKFRGLTPATDQVFKLDGPREHRVMVEAVVSDACPIVNKSIREGHFRSVYNAAVLAVARSGKRLEGKIGDIVLRAGDTLLLEASASFLQRMRDKRDFYLVSQVEDGTPPRYEKAWVALAIMVGMVALASVGVISMLGAALIAAAGMLLFRCCTGGEARGAIDLSVLVVIGCAFGVGQAIQVTGLATQVAGLLVSLGASSPHLTLLMVYASAMLFTSFLTNNAAAVLMFPIAAAAAESLGVSVLPFAAAVMFAASNDFATPIGYQTNLMVYGPGGYKFTDYLRVGVPLNLLVMGVTVLLLPIMFGF